MKKIKKILTILFVFCIFSLMSAQKALADLLPLGGEWDDIPSRPNINPYAEPKTFIDLIEPQYIIIGGAILTVIIISLFVLSIMRKK